MGATFGRTVFDQLHIKKSKNTPLGGMKHDKQEDVPEKNQGPATPPSGGEVPVKYRSRDFGRALGRAPRTIRIAC